MGNSSFFFCFVCLVLLVILREGVGVSCNLGISGLLTFLFTCFGLFGFFFGDPSSNISSSCELASSSKTSNNDIDSLTDFEGFEGFVVLADLTDFGFDSLIIFAGFTFFFGTFLTSLGSSNAFGSSFFLVTLLIGSFLTGDFFIGLTIISFLLSSLSLLSFFLFLTLTLLTSTISSSSSSIPSLLNSSSSNILV